jgi:hypothetical protein
MSEIRKWLKIMESVPAILTQQPPKDNRIKRDATVMVNANIGGGTGRFMHYTPNGAMIDIKGVAKELAEDEFSLPQRDYEDPYVQGNDWDHATDTDDTEGTMNDKPELSPGDMVRISDVYGSVIGPGFGVFVAYSTSGKECIVSFDSKEIVVPMENISSVVEQEAKDNFDDMDNDGNLSPMSFGSDNVKIEEPEMDHRDEFSKWMETVETALKGENETVLDENMPMGDTGGCECGSWNCPTCFPQPDSPGVSSMGAMAGHKACPACGHAEEVPEEPAVCPMCGNAHEGNGGDEELVQVDAQPGGMDPMSFGMEEDDGLEIDSGEDDYTMEEEPMQMDQKTSLPRGSKGGVKLGDIVQKFVPADGDDSPLTHGEDNLGEEIPGGANPGDYGKAGRYAQDHFGQLGEEDDGNPYGRRRDPDTTPDEWDDEPSEMDSDWTPSDIGRGDQEEENERSGLVDMINSMQSGGLSNSSHHYSSDELIAMGVDQLRQVSDEVLGKVSEMDDMQMDPEMDPAMATGGGGMGPSAGGGASGGAHYAPGTAPTMPESIQQGKPTMENIDKDIQTWLGRFKAYDELRASKAPVMEKKKPDFPDLDKDGDKKETMDKALKDKKKKEEVDEAADKSDKPWKDKSGKEHSGTAVKGKSYTGKEAEKEKKDVKEGADAEVLEWMGRFAKLGNMKGYGR